MTDLPFGVLLSRGLDSSLMVVVASRHLNDAEIANVYDARFYTFSINLKVMIDFD